MATKKPPTASPWTPVVRTAADHEADRAYLRDSLAKAQAGTDAHFASIRAAHDKAVADQAASERAGTADDKHQSPTAARAAEAGASRK